MKFKLAEANRDLRLLAPFVQDALEEALKECYQQGYSLIVSEAYRTPARQNYLFEQGRSRPGKIVTKARGWQSYHNYGLAIDLAGVLKGKTNYDLPWDKIAAVFKEHGFETLSDEKVHFQWPTNMTTADMKEVYMTEGLQTLWAIVSS